MNQNTTQTPKPNKCERTCACTHTIKRRDKQSYTIIINCPRCNKEITITVEEP